eukprot:403374931
MSITNQKVFREDEGNSKSKVKNRIVQNQKKNTNLNVVEAQQKMLISSMQQPPRSKISFGGTQLSSYPLNLAMKDSTSMHSFQRGMSQDQSKQGTGRIVYNNGHHNEDMMSLSGGGGNKQQALSQKKQDTQIDFEQLSKQYLQEQRGVNSSVLRPSSRQNSVNQRKSLLENIQIQNELAVVKPRRVDSDMQYQQNYQESHPKVVDKTLNLNIPSRLSIRSPQNTIYNQNQYSISNSPNNRRKSLFCHPNNNQTPSLGQVNSGQGESNQPQISQSSSKSNQLVSQNSKKFSTGLLSEKKISCIQTLKKRLVQMTSSTPYLLVNIIATGLATLLDLIRVAFFDSKSDLGFFIFMMLLQIIIVFQIIGKIVKQRRQYFLNVISFVEMAFVVLNFLSTYLVQSYSVYLAVNYLKIINVIRISNIFMFIKKRQKQLLIERFQKERERIKKKQENQVMRFNKSDKLNKQQTVARQSSPSKFNESLRGKLSQGPDQLNLSINQQSQQRISLQNQRNSEQSKISNEQHHSRIILQGRFKDQIFGADQSSSLDQMQKSNFKLENTYTDLILKRTMTIFFLCAITAPFFMNTFYNPAHETIDNFFDTFRRITEGPRFLEMPPENITAQLQKLVNIGANFEETPIIDFQSNYYNFSKLDSLNLRTNEVYVFETPMNQTIGIYMKMTVSRRDYNQLQSLLGMCAYVWYFILILFMITIITRDIEKQVIHPFNALFEKIWSLIIDPMLVVNNQFQQFAGMYSMLQNKQKRSRVNEMANDQQDQSSLDQSQIQSQIARKSHIKGFRRKKVKNSNQIEDNINNEIQLIDESLFKISKLLMLYYGEAGAQLVSKMIRSESSLLDFSEELGTKTLAIFGFCDIRNFTDATEILQEGVVSLVNKVAYIVHSNTIRYGGQPNKNIGDAFLLVWKLSSDKETYEVVKPLGKLNSKRGVHPSIRKEASIIADVAVLSVLKTISQINTAKELNIYNDNIEMHKRIPGFRIKMGFGLHLGWAIEGMIGSNFKIDASYLSPNVNIASRLEAATKQYGVQFLFSQGIYNLLSPAYQDLCRIVDKAVLKGCLTSQDLFTVDMDLNQSSGAQLNVAGLGIGMSQGVSSTQLMNGLNLDSLQTVPSARQYKQVAQDVIRNEQRCIFESLYRGEISTELMLIKCADAQEILIKSPYFKIFKLQYYQAFRLYIDGFWVEAKAEFEKCLRIFPDDGPSQVLLEYIESQNLDSKLAKWKGFRALEDK